MGLVAKWLLRGRSVAVSLDPCRNLQQSSILLRTDVFRQSVRIFDYSCDHIIRLGQTITVPAGDGTARCVKQKNDDTVGPVFPGTIVRPGVFYAATKRFDA